jgi:cell division septation protein DedD
MVLIWIVIQPFSDRPAVVETPSPAKIDTVPVIDDPFTIQVAAYLKSQDAQRYVDMLKSKGLDAFWTKAASAKRTWYQVKVSHFATKESARRYGRELKSKGLIDDFYVANYDGTTRTSTQSPPP